MSEPPLKVSAEGVELEPRRHGHRWVDFAVSGSAILISLISLVVAIQHGKTQERMVSAYSWPFVQAENSNMNDAGKSVIEVRMTNGGVGQAVMRDFRMFYDGRPVRSPGEVLQRCCGWAKGFDLSDGGNVAKVLRTVPMPELMRAEGLTTGDPLGVLKPGGTRVMIKFAATRSNLDLWQALNASRHRLSYSACYCSVLGECWTSDLESMDPKPVDACSKPGPETFVG